MKILGLIVGFVVTPITIHELGMANYGLWAILNGVIGYFTLLDFGVGSTFITQFALYYAAGNRRGIRDVMTFGFIFYLLLGLAFTPVAGYVAPHLGQWFHMDASETVMIVRVFWWTYVYLFLSQAVGGFGTLLNAAQKMVFTSILGFVSQLLNYVILITTLRMHFSLDSFVIANFVSLLFSTAISFVAAHRMMRMPLMCAPWRIQWDTLKSLLSFGGWMQINSLSNQVNMETDRVLIGTFVRAEATGVYQLGNKLALLCRYLPLNLLGALLPAISEMQSHGENDKIRNTYLKGSRYLAMATFYVAGFVLFANGPISALWLGKFHPDLTLILFLLVPAYVINNLTGMGTTILRAIAKPKLETYYAMLGAGLNIVLTLSLAPRFGMPGILLGTVIATLTSSLYFINLFQKTIGLSWWDGLLQWLWPIVVATVVPGFSIHILSTLLPTIPLGRFGEFMLVMALGSTYTTLFLLVLIFLRYFKVEDSEILLRLIPKRVLSPRVNRAIHLIVGEVST